MLTRVRFACFGVVHPKNESFSRPPRAYPELGSPSHGVRLHPRIRRGWKTVLDTHWGQTLHRMKSDLLEIFKNYLAEYYSPMRRNRLLLLAAIRLNLRDINMSERSSPQISTCCLIY